MASIGTMTCARCAHTFPGAIGNTMYGVRLRCLECDAERLVPWSLLSPPGSLRAPAEDHRVACDRCGRLSLRAGLRPRCPQCGSRDTDMTSVDIVAD